MRYYYLISFVSGAIIVSVTFSQPAAAANGGAAISSDTANYTVGGVGGIDGSLISAMGGDAASRSDGKTSGGGGGAVDLTTGQGAPGGSRSTPGAPLPDGGTGLTGAINVEQVSTGILGGTGLQATGAGGGGGGGVGVSTTLDLTVTGSGAVSGGRGATGLSSSGGGGGGVGIFSSGNLQILSGGVVHGGIGGQAAAYSGGGGGAAAVLLTGGGTITNSGIVMGGAGGKVNPGLPTLAGAGGNGGEGVLLTAGGAVNNNSGGVISGGAFGANGTNISRFGIENSEGGSGVVGANVTIVNAGTISGALSSGGGRVDAIKFTGGKNSLALQSTSVINGNVQAFSSDDELILSGVNHATLDAQTIGNAAQYRGFGKFEKTGTSVWALNNATSALTPWTLSQGTLSIARDGSLGDLAGDLIFNGGTLQTTQSFAMDRAVIFGAVGGKIETSAGTTLTIVGIISGDGALTHMGDGTLILKGENTFTRGTVIESGTLSVSADTVLGQTSGAVTLNGGDLKVTAPMVTSRAIVAGENGGNIYSDSNLSFGNVLGTGAITKTGDGILTLTGTDTGYAGTFSVAAGGLNVSGAIGGDVVVQTGAQVSGNGSINHNLNVEGGGALDGQVGQQLHIGNNLILADGSTTNVSLGAPTADAQFSVQNDLHLGGTLNVTDAGGFSPGVYRIFDYGGSLSGTMTIGVLPANTERDRVTMQTAVDHQVNLINATDAELSFWDGQSPANIDNNKIDGGTGIWDNHLQNWTDDQGAQNGNWHPNAFAVFSGQSGVVSIDDSAGNISASGLQFMTDGYSLDGNALNLDNANATPIITVGDHSANSASMTATINAVLTGTHGLEKNDAGKLVLTSDNLYTGTTTIDAGTLQLGNGGVSGSVIGNIQNNGMLSIDRHDDLAFANQIDGTGNVLKLGNNVVTFTADNSFSGGLEVKDGAALAGFDNTAFGSGILSVDIDGTADLNKYNTTVAGLTGSGNVNLTQATLTLQQDRDLTFSGTISGDGGLNKSGSGVLSLSGANSYSGLTNVNDGAIYQTGQGAISAASSYSVSAPATLDLGGFNSSMAGLTNAGTIRFGGSTAGTVLTVNGDYHGDGGMFVINTVLADDQSSTDLLQVRGSTSGNANLQVVNRGGLGGLTINGIEVVDVSGASNGSFALTKGDFVTKDGQQAVIGGAYAYTLHKNGVTTPDDGNWYLRSELKDPSNSIPDNPGNPTTPNDPLYSPTAPVYEGVVNNMQALNKLPTLRERVGDRYRHDDPQALFDMSQYSDDQNGQADQSGQNGPTSGQAIWARIEGAYDSLQPYGTTDHFNQDISQMRYQAGVDGKLYDGDDGQLFVGVSGQYGTAHSKIGSTSGTGTIDTNAWSLHSSLTWYGNDGFYVDAQAQTSWYSNDLFSNTANNGFANGKHGFGYAMSLETGKQFDLDDTWSLTPQAQLMWSSVRLNSFDDAYQSSVSMRDGNNLSMRLGLAADYRNAWTTVAGTPVKSNLYGLMNLYQSFDGSSDMVVSGAELNTANDKTWAGIGWGANIAWDNQYAIYGQGTVNTSLNHFGESYSVSGTIGFRMRW